MRLDEYVVQQGFRVDLARALIMEGRALVNERVESRPGIPLRKNDVVRLRLPERLRGYRKLAGILEKIDLDLAGRICLDIGAAHGGFCRLMLEKGAAFVYAVDVGYGQLEFDLRQRDEVIVLERSHIKDISEAWFRAEHCSGPFFVTCDVSFISVRSVLLALIAYRKLCQAGLPWEGLFLFKPQFEKSQETLGGILPESESLQARLEFQDWLALSSIANLGEYAAALRGKKGNQEYFYHLQL